MSGCGDRRGRPAKSGIRAVVLALLSVAAHAASAPSVVWAQQSAARSAGEATRAPTVAPLPDLVLLARRPVVADSLDVLPDRGGDDDEGDDRHGSTSSLPSSLRRPVLAFGEVAGLNALVYTWDTAVRRDRNFGVSPSSVWRNLGSVQFDGSHLEVNQVGHPYHGGLFFNAGRANGYGFAASSAFALAGTVMWECCFEVEPPSINDLVFTSIGGVAMGEATHRLGALAYRPSATGLEGLGRGLLGFVLDPMGGVTRLATGRTASWGRPYEGVGSVQFDAFLGLGGRVRLGDAHGDADGSAPAVDLRVSYGGILPGGPEKPYDAFEMRVRVEPSALPLRRLVVDGVLGSRSLGSTGGSRDARIRMRQRLDFLRDADLGYGSTSLTLGPRVTWRMGGASTLEVFAAGEWAILTAFEAGREGESASDYGPGIGARAGAMLRLGGHERLRVDHSVVWTHTMRGLSTSNRLQVLEARASVLRVASTALALDLTAVRRLGHMIEGPDVREGSTSLRVFAALDVGGRARSGDWR